MMSRAPFICLLVILFISCSERQKVALEQPAKTWIFGDTLIIELWDTGTYSYLEFKYLDSSKHVHFSTIKVLAYYKIPQADSFANNPTDTHVLANGYALITPVDSIANTSNDSIRSLFVRDSMYQIYRGDTLVKTAYAVERAEEGYSSYGNVLFIVFPETSDTIGLHRFYGDKGIRVLIWDPYQLKPMTWKEYQDSGPFSLMNLSLDSTNGLGYYTDSIDTITSMQGDSMVQTIIYHGGIRCQ